MSLVVRLASQPLVGTQAEPRDGRQAGAIGQVIARQAPGRGDQPSADQPHCGTAHTTAATMAARLSRSPPLVGVCHALPKPPTTAMPTLAKNARYTLSGWLRASVIRDAMTVAIRA